MSESWCRMTAADLGRSIGAGAIDPRDLTESYLDAIKSHQYRDKIYARTTDARAQAEAEASATRARKGERVGLLDGVPISWKDLFDTSGVTTEAGSRLLLGRVPDDDATVVKNAKQQGLICLGKVHMSELAFSGLGLNPSTATPPNVHNSAHAPGGSSSGSAASVGFGLAAASIGSDTGGSVRIPSAWNDLVGYKSTHGLMSLKGIVPLCPSFDTPGPICRSVEDAALLGSALLGEKPATPEDMDISHLRFLELNLEPVGPTDQDPARAVAASADRLRAAGASVETGSIDFIPEMLALSSCLYTSEAWGLWRETIEANPGVMYDQIEKRFRTGEEQMAADYVASWRALKKYREAFEDLTSDYDAVILPTSPILPPDTARLLSDQGFYTSQNLLALRNTRIGNLLGLCALSLPTGVAGCGLMVQSSPFSDTRLLEVGRCIEDIVTP